MQGPSRFLKKQVYHSICENQTEKRKYGEKWARNKTMVITQLADKHRCRTRDIYSLFSALMSDIETIEWIVL